MSKTRVHLNGIYTSETNLKLMHIDFKYRKDLSSAFLIFQFLIKKFFTCRSQFTKISKRLNIKKKKKKWIKQVNY